MKTLYYFGKVSKNMKVLQNKIFKHRRVTLASLQNSFSMHPFPVCYKKIEVQVYVKEQKIFKKKLPLN